MKKAILCAFAAMVLASQAMAQPGADTFEGAIFRKITEVEGGARIEQFYNESRLPSQGGVFTDNLFSWDDQSAATKVGRKISALVKTSDFSFYSALDTAEELAPNNMNAISARFIDRKTLDVTLMAKTPILGFQRLTLVPPTYEKFVLVNLTREVESTYALFTMYIVPDEEVPPELQGKLPHYIDYGGFMVFTMNEAEIVDGRVVLGAQLASGRVEEQNSVSDRIALDKKQVELWSRSPYLFAGPQDPGPWSLGPYSMLGILWRESKPDAWGFYPPKRYVDAATSALAYVEDIKIPLVEKSESHRARRCVTAYDWLGGAFYQFIQIIRGRGLWALSGTDACPSSEPDVIPVIDTQPTGTPLLTLIDSHTTAVTNDDSFAAAMNYQVCLDRPETDDVDEGVCTAGERAELTSMAELSFTEIQSAITAITTYLDEAAVGAGSSRLPVTTSAALNTIITNNPQHALGLLNNAARIAYSSGASATPSAPIAPRADSAKGKKKRKGVGSASCTTKAVAADDGFQCVQQGVRRRRPATEQTDVTSLGAQVSNGGRYYRPSDAGYAQLARTVVNTRVGLPFGMTEANFNSGSGYIAAAAYDGMRVGQGRLVVYLPNVTGQRGDTARFSYGLQHIWTTRLGGHQNEWETLGVTSSAMLTDLIMSALVSHGPVDISRDPNRPTNQRRNYASISFTYGSETYVVTNVVIVVSDNGMVITAYPSTNRRNPSTLSAAKELKR
ncbi:hypothetical protein [Lysobacter antibioticus]|nr:hypothetical protein [Lysobacter antibioticus]